MAQEPQGVSATPKRVSGVTGWPSLAHSAYLGRVIIEVYEPSEEAPDGVAYFVEAHSTDLATIDKFARAAVSKLQERLAKQRPIE